jgi:multisubunit Na+/H+ antiporter MnhE subunit
VIVVLAMHNSFSNGDSFRTLFTISIACFGMTYVFSAIMLLLSYRLLDSFDNKQYVRLIKIIGFIPLANISMIYFVSALSYQKKKSIKDIVDNGK